MATWFICPAVLRARPNLASLPLAVALVVGGLARQPYAVGMAFGLAGRRDAHEPRPLTQVLEAGGTHVAHAGAQAADQLMQHGVHRAFVGYLALDALRHQLER